MLAPQPPTPGRVGSWEKALYQLTVIAYPVLSDYRVAINVLAVDGAGRSSPVWSSWSQVPIPPWCAEAPEDWVQLVGDQVLTLAFREQAPF